MAYRFNYSTVLKSIYWYDFNNIQNTYITMIYTMRCCRWIIDSLRSIYCKKCSSLHIPFDLNKTSVRGSILQYKIFQLYQEYFRKRKELIFYNYAVQISIYILFLPSFLAVTVQAVAVLNSIIGTGRLLEIAVDYSVTYSFRLIYILFAVLTHYLTKLLMWYILLILLSLTRFRLYQ